MTIERSDESEQKPDDSEIKKTFPDNEDIIGLNKTKSFDVHSTPELSGKRLSPKARIALFSGTALVGVLVILGIMMSGHRHESNNGSGGVPDTSQIGTATPPAPPPILSSSTASPGSTSDSQKSRGHQKITSNSSQLNNQTGSRTGNTGSMRPQLEQRPSALNDYRQWKLRQRYHFYESRIKADYAAYDAPLSTGGSGMMPTSSLPASSLSPEPSDSSMHDLARSQLNLLRHYENHAAQGKNAKTKHWNPKAKGSGYLTAQLKKPRSKHELFSGSIIPAVMITGINSDLPGEITAQVRQTVYNSLNPSQVLIPQGSRLVGVYDSGIAYGQSRVMVAWTRLILPNGQTLNLGAMSGVDGQGEAGFHDQVNNHYLRIFGSAFLISLLGTGAQLSQPQTGSMYSTPTATQQAIASMSEEWNNVGSQLLQKNLNIKPTLIIHPGYEFNVFVRKTIILPVWRP